jgi:hypothetical protein
MDYDKLYYSVFSAKQLEETTQGPQKKFGRPHVAR